jgi:hypothetical protein
VSTNRFGAICASSGCGVYVQPGEGVLVRRDSGQGWLVFCLSHAPDHERHEVTADGSTVTWRTGREFPLPADPEGRSHDPIAAFLLARLEDESAIAAAAWITHWRQPAPEAESIVDDHDVQVAWFNERDTARHAAGWGPLRVLDHVSARRLVVDAYEDTPVGTAKWETLRQVLCLLSLPYADHPDWQPEWGPNPPFDKHRSRSD